MKKAAGFLIFSMDTQRALLLWGPKGWELPGGMSFPNERSIDTALRELAEETGYTGPLTHLGAMTITQRADGVYVSVGSPRQGKLSYHVYLVQVETEFEPQLSHEHADWHWFTPLDLVSTREHGMMHPGVVETLYHYDCYLR